MSNRRGQPRRTSRSNPEISFTAERPFGTFTYNGKVSGSEIKFKVTFNEQNIEMTVKRI
jgi:hypothetical protein